jgi:NAD(P)-dependent dehydrogenase (short-subunit alcohol dehydrogenase family)
MTGRVCLVTGATSGIGKATAVALARLGATIIVHGRNPEKCDAVAAELRQVSGGRPVETIVADFSSLAEVRQMAAEFHRRFPKLHVLVNNAGLSLKSRRESPEGFELMFAVNHLAPFLLTNLLLDVLAINAPARIVAVSSGLHRQKEIDFDDLQAKRKFSSFRTYGLSKLANIMFTNELARHLLGTGVTANSLGPGMVATNIGMDEGGMFAFSKRVMDRIMGKSPEEGARTVVYLASSPEVEGVTGKYFEDMKEVPSSPASLDVEAARRLWDVSAELTGLKQG